MSTPDPVQRASAPDDVARVVLELATGLARELHRGAAIEQATLGSAIDRDLGLDSLARVELVARLESRFGVAIDEQAAFAAETPADLVRVLTGSGVAAANAGAAPAAEGAWRPARPGTPAATARTLVDMLRWHVDADPQRVHVRFYEDDADGAVMTHGELWHEGGAVAAGLQARGLEPGETVVLMLPTGRDYFRAFYGVLLAGGIPVPIYPPARRSQLEDHLRRQSAILRNARAAMLLTVPEATLAARLLSSQVETLREVATVADLGDDAAGAEIAAPGPDDIAFLQYTSGSTGDPKGVVLSHANLLANVRADGKGIEVDAGDVFVSWLPLYHDMGLIGAWLGSLYHGIPLVIMSPLAFLARPQRWLWAMHRHGGTLSAAPNFAFELCNRRIRDEDIEGLDLGRWRLALNGAEPISPATMEHFCERFAPYGFRRETMLPVYGLAECAVGLAFSPLGRGPVVDRIERRPLMDAGRAVPAVAHDATALEFAACGRPLPGHELRVVDASGRELPERRQGRLQFRGPSATRGYHRAPEHTRRLFQDGWLETGDPAYIASGELHVTGRTKDLIIKAGRNVYPAELEGAVAALDGVRAGHVAAFGSADPATGTERLVVVVETRLRKPETREALRQRVNELATVVGMPADEVVLAPPGAVLKTSSGKVRRAASRELYESGRIGAPETRVWVQVARLALAGVAPQLRRGLRAAGVYAYGACAWVALAAAAATAFAVVLAPLSPGTRWGVLHRLARALTAALGIGLEVHGRVPDPGAEPLIVASNHQSYIDGFVLVAALPRPVAFLAKAELTGVPGVHFILRRIGTRFVRRFEAASALEDLRAAAADMGAAPLLIFPEGTFKRMPGLLPFHMGAFIAAVGAGARVVPVAIAGTRSILRAGGWLPRRGDVCVHVGEPIAPAPAAQGWRAAIDLRDAVREHILAYGAEPDLAHESNRVED